MGIPGEPCGTCGHTLVSHKPAGGCTKCDCQEFIFGPGTLSPNEQLFAHVDDCGQCQESLWKLCERGAVLLRKML